MRLTKNLDDWRDRRQAIRGSVGFVPTMGALHAGHASLVERCRKENATVVVSIFINPSQFNETTDLERYPRTLEADLALLKDLGTDEVFLPSTTEIYPDGYAFRVEPEQNLGGVMEGAYRPGFLQGVLTVVLKLFSLVRPHRAYFGEKDYQQLKAVEGMVRDFFLPTTIIPCATLREPSGLAMSSRNTLLSSEGRSKAASIFRILTTSPNAGQAAATLAAEGFQVDYVSDYWGRRLAAASLEGIRLIDNIPLPTI